MSHISKTTAAYIAGFIDGEGYLGIISDARRKNYRRTDSYNCTLKIANTNEDIIRWFHQSYGGTLNKRHLGGNAKDAFCWTLAGPKLIPFLQKVKPYLRIKKEQAEIICRFRKTYAKDSYNYVRRQTNNGGTFVSKTTRPSIIAKREELYQQIKGLNKRGVLYAERLTEVTP